MIEKSDRELLERLAVIRPNGLGMSLEDAINCIARVLLEIAPLQAEEKAVQEPLTHIKGKGLQEW